MTLVRNHLLPSSGNKGFLLLIFCINIVLWSSCSTPTKVIAPSVPKVEAKPEVYNPTTKKYEPANNHNTKVDTIKWKESGIPPFITDNGRAGNVITAEKKNQLNISVLLPISEEDLNKDLTAEGSEKYFHYYAGMKMALDKIEIGDIKINLTINDLKPSADAIQPILQSEVLQSADLIIGPLRRDHLNETAKLARDKNIPMVAPWNAFRTLENINQNYILLKSSLPTHCETLSQYILKNHKPSDIVLVGREKSRTLMGYFQAEIEKSSPDKLKLKQCVVKDDYKFGEEYKYLDSSKSVYIVTEFEDPAVVFNFIRHINMMRKSRSVTVIGMPSWQDYSRDYFSLFSQLNVLISTSSFPDYTDDKVVEFRKDFFKQYQNFPLKEAFEGYDAIQFVVNQMTKYGKQFHISNISETYHGLATPIKLEKIIDLSKPIDDRLLNNNVLCIENKALNILKFDQFKFVKVQ